MEKLKKSAFEGFVHNLGQAEKKAVAMQDI